MSALNSGRYCGESSPAEMEEEQARQAIFREVFGIQLPPRNDEASAPPVNMDALHKLVKGELAGDQEATIAGLCLVFRSWLEALLRVEIDNNNSTISN